MENSILVMISLFLPLMLPVLFGESGPLAAQAQTGQPSAGPPPAESSRAEGSGMGMPPMGQPSGGAAVIQGLETYALPGGAVSEEDMPGIRVRIEQVLGKISELATSGGNRVDYPSIRSNLLAFRDWLRAQGCVVEASSSYDFENMDLYDDSIFITHPGQLPFDIVFRMTGEVHQAYRLLLFVTTYDLFNFGSLVKNNAEEEVFIPERWPEDAPAFWESRS